MFRTTSFPAWSPAGKRALCDLIVEVALIPSQSVLCKHFIDPLNAAIARVVDHVEYIASRTSRKHVGLASDFDGMSEVVEGLEDVSR